MDEMMEKTRCELVYMEDGKPGSLASSQEVVARVERQHLEDMIRWDRSEEAVPKSNLNARQCMHVQWTVALPRCHIPELPMS
jgi:hypothetical protein